jgi:hypothetical protein
MNARRAAGIFSIVSMLSVLSVVPAAAVAPGDVRWIAEASGPVDGQDEPTDIALSPDGGTAFVTGMSHSSPCAGICLYTDDAMTVAYDTATGAEDWRARYDGPVPDGLGRFDTDVARAVAVSPDGSTVVIAGSSAADVVDQYPPTDMLAIAYDATDGDQLWLVRRGDPTRQETGVDVAIAPDGSAAFVTGTTPDGGGDQDDITTIALDLTDGSELWAATYDGPERTDIPAAIAVSPDGSTVAVTGMSEGAGDDAVTLLYDATDGSPIAARRYDGRAHGDDRATDVAFGADGTVFVTGSSAGATSSRTVTIAYTAGTFVTTWVHREDVGAGREFGVAVEVGLGDQHVVVGGTARIITSRRKDDDMFVMVLRTSDGGLEWLRRTNIDDGSDQLAAVEVTPDGTRILTAGSHYDRRWGLVASAFGASDGARLWRVTMDRKGAELAVAAAADGDGLYVTGAGSNGGAWDFLTAAFEI